MGREQGKSEEAWFCPPLPAQPCGSENGLGESHSFLGSRREPGKNECFPSRQVAFSPSNSPHPTVLPVFLTTALSYSSFMFFLDVSDHPTPLVAVGFFSLVVCFQGPLL